LLSKDYCNSLFEVCRTVSFLEASIEELVEAWEKDVQYLVEDAVCNIVSTWSLVRGSSIYCFLDLRRYDLWVFNRLRIYISINIR
jgi:hypothetical protein